MTPDGKIRAVVVDGRQPAIEIDLSGWTFAQIESFRAAWQVAVVGDGHVILQADGERLRLEGKPTRRGRGARDGVGEIFRSDLRALRGRVTSADAAAYPYRRGM